MPSFPIRLFGDPVLKQRAREVEEFDGSLAGIVETMYDTMYEAIGLGLAAPQVGVQKRLFTYDVGEGPTVIVNPEIVETSGEFAYEEGCLSVPGLKFEIVRPKIVTIRGVDLNGGEVVVEGTEVLARVFLHEVDHLEGTLLIERLDPDQKKDAMRVLRSRVLDPR